MNLEPIHRRHFAQSDRAELQERVAVQVERDPETFLSRYLADPRSFGGRYVNSDLIKETFPEYSASPAARNRYNSPVHNAAAVLASEQFRRTVGDTADPRRTRALFLTGIPGAGKTTYVLRGGELPPDVRVLYEGQLANPGQALPKLSLARNAGLRLWITVVHLDPEQALRNTFLRFASHGRGASIEAMAAIQGHLPDGLRAVYKEFGETVDLRIVDRRGTLLQELRGWQHLSILESEGDYERIKRTLARAVDREFRAGRISVDTRDQALGRALPEHP
jgi:hypothetical protein